MGVPRQAPSTQLPHYAPKRSLRLCSRVPVKGLDDCKSWEAIRSVVALRTGTDTAKTRRLHFSPAFPPFFRCSNLDEKANPLCNKG